MAAVFLARTDRSLLFSPDWDGGCLVFDRLTTDLFVVPEIGRPLLEALLQGGPMDARMLLAELSGGDATPDADSEAQIDRLLLELQASGLVEELCVDCCGPD